MVQKNRLNPFKNMFFKVSHNFFLFFLFFSLDRCRGKTENHKNHEIKVKLFSDLQNGHFKNVQN